MTLARPRPRRAPTPRSLAAAVLLATACATNPATGEKELSLVGEGQEIELGRANDRQVVQTLGVYPDSALGAYVERVGRRLAALSERPDLPWTFRVVDDPTVNAFALPGGFIYVTRGLLAHLGSEAELAGVLGHEIGHVTARHAVSQLSRAQLANLGLGLGTILAPDLAKYGDLASTGLGLLFLKYGRDDERQSDDLAIRYLRRAGYDPRPMAEVFTVLERVSRMQGAGRIPDWLSTHPSPEERRTRTEEALAAPDSAFEGARVERDAYLRGLDGIVFGENPREGLFREGAFLHPELAFRITFPRGWTGVNRKTFVAAASPRGDAVVELTVTGEASLETAARAFAAQRGVRTGRFVRRDVNDLPAAWAAFEAAAGQTPVRGVVAFVSHGGRTYQLLGYAVRRAWPSYEAAVTSSLASFARLQDPDVLALQPDRIELVTLAEPLSVREFAARYPSTVSLEAVALINHVEPTGTLPAGVAVKRVRAGGSAGARVSLGRTGAGR